MDKIKIQNDIQKVLENFENVEFKTEGLGALEFEKEMYSKGFELQKVKFRIERVPLQIANKLLEKENFGTREIEETLKNYIAEPAEARNIGFFELDYNSMNDIMELIASFQVNPFFFTEAARKSKEDITK